jgi:hypothetical protein
LREIFGNKHYLFSLLHYLHLLLFILLFIILLLFLSSTFTI